jgi:hypothetical protein
VARSANKTVRFTQVVERSGAPQVHTLWLSPEKDPELQRAEKTHRVMTIHPAGSGGKTDVGTVGFKSDEGSNAQFLIFPKSLKRFEGARVVGIKFDLVEQPKLASVDALKQMAVARPRGAATKRSAQRALFPAGELKTPPPQTKPLPPSAEPTQSSDEPDGDVVPFEHEGAALQKPTTGKKRPHKPDTVRVAAAGTKTRATRRKSPERDATAREMRVNTSEESKGEFTSPGVSPADTALVREIHLAMKDLQRGKSVAAYQRLERAVSKTNGTR